MGFGEVMNLSFEYIERYLSRGIEATDVAKAAGYSYFHFCRIFKLWCGCTVGEYLRRRRMSVAVEHLLTGKRVIDVAVMCGFDTASGFSRAFTREFGVSPSEFREENIYGAILDEPENIWGYNASNPSQLGEFYEPVAPDISVVNIEGFRAVCYSVNPPAGSAIDASESGAYWVDLDFSRYDEAAYERLNPNLCGEIGTWLMPLDRAGDPTYYFGPVVQDFAFVPRGMKRVEFPAGKYAVSCIQPSPNILLDALKEEISRAWRYMIADWLDTGGFELYEHGRIFERYHNGLIELYLPLLELD